MLRLTLEKGVEKGRRGDVGAISTPMQPGAGRLDQFVADFVATACSSRRSAGGGDYSFGDGREHWRSWRSFPALCRAPISGAAWVLLLLSKISFAWFGWTSTLKPGADAGVRLLQSVTDDETLASICRRID